MLRREKKGEFVVRVCDAIGKRVFTSEIRNTCLLVFVSLESWSCRVVALVLTNCINFIHSRLKREMHYSCRNQ